EAVEYAREDQYAERALHLVRQHRRPHVAITEVPLTLSAHAGDGVEADGHAHVLRGRPERIVDVGAIGLIRRREAPDHGPFEPELGASLELVGARLRVVERDEHEPGRTRGRVRAVRGEPVVVDAEAVPLEVGVLQPEDPEAERRVKDVGLDAIEFVVLETLGGIPATGASVGVRPSREELGQLLGTLACAETDTDRMWRVAFVVEIGAVRVARVLDQPWSPVAILLLDAGGP